MPRGQHDHRLVQSHLAHLAANVKPRSIRQTDIQQDQMRRVLLNIVDALDSIGPQNHTEAFAHQASFEALRNGGVVLDD